MQLNQAIESFIDYLEMIDRSKSLKMITGIHLVSLTNFYRINIMACLCGRYSATGFRGFSDA